MKTDEAKTTNDNGDEPIDLPGRRFWAHREGRPLRTLHLDRDNPRIRHATMEADSKGKTLTEREIEEMLWAEPSVKALYRGIINSGGTDRLWILDDGTVKEGNERLVCFRKVAENLAKRGGESAFPPKVVERLRANVADVPCLVFPEDVTASEIDILLARQHVSGTDPWPAFDQAAHVYRLNHDDGMDVAVIGENIRKSKPWVYQKIKAFEWTRDYREMYPDAPITDFSFFEELYKTRARLKDVGFDIEEPENLRKVWKAVKGGEITWAIDVRRLPKVMENRRAREKFLAGDVQEAFESLVDIDPGQFSPRLKAIAAAREQMKKVTREDMEAIRKHPQYQRVIRELRE